MHLYCESVFNSLWRIMHAAAAAFEFSLRPLSVCIPVLQSAVFHVPCCFNIHSGLFLSWFFWVVLELCVTINRSLIYNEMKKPKAYGFSGWRIITENATCWMRSCVREIRLGGDRVIVKWPCDQSVALSLLFTPRISKLLKESSTRLPVCCKGQRGFVLA